MTALLLRLAGPMQSWGAAARFARRSTESAPTKSGVLGLLAAAQGRPREAELSDLAALRFGVRIDQPGSRMRDYHTAQHADSGKVMPVSERYYLSDAVFVAGVEGDAALLHRLYRALLEPYYLPYLGRLCCPPSRPVQMGPPVDTSLNEALRGAPWQASPWYVRQLAHAPESASGTSETEPLELLLDCPPSERPHLSLKDTPASFDPRHRRYQLRGLISDQASPASHDPTAGLRPVGPGDQSTTESFSRTD